MKNLSERIRAVVEAKDMTQGEVAEYFGIGQSMVSQYLSGNKTVPEQLLPKFARLLDIETAWLTDGTPPAPEILLEKILRESRWVFRQQHPDGGREFGNPGVWTIPWNLQTLVREAVQNILDARISEVELVRVRFSLIELTGNDRKRFLRAVDVETDDETPSLKAHLEASTAGASKLAGDLTAGLAKLRDSERIILLRIEDRGTIGLTGEEYGPGNYTALVRNQLDTHKATSSAGGAYGLGKAVLWRASRLSTVFFNTIPSEPTPSGRRMRLIGKTELPFHKAEGDDFAGPGWFGYADKRGGDEIVAAKAIRDSQVLAEELYIPRESNDTGTSVLVVGFYTPSSDEDVDLQRTAQEIQMAAARYFWPALLERNLEITVSTQRGHTNLTDIPTDPFQYEPEYAQMLQKYYSGDLSDQLKEPGDVAAKQVILDIPRRTASDKRHETDTHSAVLLVRRDSTDNKPLNKMAYYRSPGMIINHLDIRPPSLGSVPFRAVLIAGQAVDSEDSSKHAELFLRAAEPPAHNTWKLTPDVKSSYQRGGGKALNDFFQNAREAIYEEIRPHYDEDDNEGPRILSELIKIVEPQPTAERKPSLQILKYGIAKDLSWVIKARINIPVSGRWRITPTIRFAAETGRGAQVDWRLEAESGCQVDEGVIIIEPGTTRATFIGRTDPASHPSSSRETAVDILLSKTIREDE